MGNVKDYILKVVCNVYGQRQSGKKQNKYLINFLFNKLNFIQSSFGKYLFYRGKILCVLYTNDSALSSLNKKEIDKVIDKIKQYNLKITILEDIKNLLGINIKN